MNVGVIIPTRGDRSRFLDFAIKRMKNQTRKVDLLEIVDDVPQTSKKDITWRYRNGCNRIFSKGADVAFLIEDDDWYSFDYIERMIEEWKRIGQPKLFGIGETFYYHLQTNGIYHEVHRKRASAMSTMVTPSILNMPWPNDHEPFTDIHIWKSMLGATSVFEKPISLGIKHAIGMSGGSAHNPRWGGYRRKDLNWEWLKQTVDEEAFNFYKNVLR